MPTLIEDTIAAISTPLGKSGLGVIRLSGPDSIPIVEKIFNSHGRGLQDHGAVLGLLRDPASGQILDQVVATCFRAPRSYTREDVVELSCHGSPVLLRAILQTLMDCGARLACPGEFTLRAFLHGRLDLLQAEAVHDLIEAKTLFQAQVARQQASGSLSRRVRPAKEALLQLIAWLEAGIDFAEDDVPVPSCREIRERLEPLIEDLARLHSTFRFGRVVTEGMSLALVGRPNVGKSSLFNALLEQDRAIVTDIPGTTRDLVTETAQIHGIPVRLQDTAGIREVKDLLERLGVDKSFEALADADEVVLLLDGSEPLTPEDLRLFQALEGRRYFLVINKTDLPQGIEPGAIQHSAASLCRISARTREGIEGLKSLLFQDLLQAAGTEAEGAFLTNVRHENRVNEALEALRRAETGVGQDLPHELLLLDLYVGLKALNALTGETTVEDILDNIFSRFCVGK